ncbi:MAG: transglycosylase domain-containing protein [Filifactoraceae bacterium]
MKKKTKRKYNIFRLLITMILSLMLIGATCCVGLIVYVVATSEDIDFTRMADQLDQSSFIYDKDGNLIEKISSGELQVIVPMDQISPWVKQAVVSIEDERFYEHNGVDVKRVFGSAWANLRTFSFSQGASTISMQVAKNLYTSSEKSIVRKVRDAYYALEMEKVLSKEQILHAYLNTIPLSRGTVGIEAAANTFFNKSAAQLDLAESAMLAGVTQSPTRLSPYTTQPIDPNGDLGNMQIAILVSREDTPQPTAEDLGIYKRLYSLGKVGDNDYEYLKNGKKYARQAIVNDKSKTRQELVLRKMVENKVIDKETYEASKAQPIQLNLRVKPSSKGTSYFTDTMMEQVRDVLIKEGYKEEDVDTMLASGGLRIFSTMDKVIQDKIQAQADNARNFPGAFVDENGVVQPQTSIVVMDQMTGQVKGLVGGRNLVGSKLFNRATNPRQPGSAIKPLVAYMPALEGGMTAATLINDSPRPNGKGGYWPKNAEGYKGQSTLGPLIASSSNVAAVEILNKIGINTGLNSLKEQGFTTLVTRHDNRKVNDENLSLALGGMTKGVTNLDITRGFATIANGGTKIEPTFFTKIETVSGRVIYESKPEKTKMFSEENCYIMTHMMETALRSGTGQYGRLNNMTAAGKTGTTTDKKDTWFVGYTPYYTAGVWIGADMPVELYDHSRMAARLWKNVMNDVHEGLENKEFTVPSGVIAVEIDKRTGGVAKGYGITEYFIKGTEPTEQIFTEEDVLDSAFDDLFDDEIKDSTIDSGNNDMEEGFVPGTENPDSIPSENPETNVTDLGLGQPTTLPIVPTEPITPPTTPSNTPQPNNTNGVMGDLLG